jgi:hypothetical protein
MAIVTFLAVRFLGASGFGTIPDMSAAQDVQMLRDAMREKLRCGGMRT